MQFHHNRKERKTMADLMNIKMRARETLKSYLDRLTNELNQCDYVDDKLVPIMFRDGLLREHELHEILTRRRPNSMADMATENIK